ncbi:MAG: class I SAM-dependent methyltransferase [Thermomicrobiales bacterium]
MNTEQDAPDLRQLTDETRAIWDGNADWWADYIGEGNQFQLEIANPPTERLLALRPGERVLDVACGNGPFSRRMAKAGAEVVAFDFSERFIARARQRSAETGDQIEYHVLDATDEARLLTLGERRFDAAVCNQALMDMTTIEPLLGALARLLKVGGRFVFSVPHPCFHSTATRMVAEREDRAGELVTTYAVKVFDYLGLAPTKGLGIIGQPQPHYYFDRPLTVLFGSCFAAGFALDGLEEPIDPTGPDPSRPFSFQNMPGIPMALVARMRLIG